MRRLEQILQILSNALMVLGAIALFAMMLHITADVAGKYLFNRPIVGTLETVARYYMVLVVFLPIAFVQLHRQHLMVEIFTLKVTGRGVAALDGAVALLGVVYAGILAWLVYGQAVDQTALGEFVSLTYFDMPVWPSRWVLPLSFGLLCLVMLAQAVLDLRVAITGEGTPTASMAKDELDAESVPGGGS